MGFLTICGIRGVIYNKEIFKQYGLGVPKTREELDNIVEVLKANGVVPFASHFQENWSAGNMTMQFMLNDIFAKDATWGDAFRSGRENFLGNEGGSILYGVQQICLLENSFEDALAVDQAVCDNRFDNGEAAMYVTGTWSLQFANQYEKSDTYGIFPYPNLTGDAKLIRETNMTFMKVRIHNIRMRSIRFFRCFYPMKN